jgi:predicted glycosyltransferase
VSRRALFHVQHLLGIGHVMRVAQVARETAALGLEVTVLSGGGRLGLNWGAADVRDLPAARARDGSFKVLVDGSGRPLDPAFHQRRRVLVLDAFARLQPDVVLMESYPFGRRAFHSELDALVAAAQERRPRAAVLVSIRDILVAKNSPARYTEIAQRIRRDIDAVLVHGDPRLVALEASFPAAPEIADKLRYTGYVTDAGEAAPAGVRLDAGRGEVLVSAGGGAVGAPLLKAALAARPLTSLRDRVWRLITGPNLPQEDYDALARQLSAGVLLERFRPDFQSLLRHCHLSLSQAGYNTILDVLQAGARAVVVPFAKGGETEQALRARLLAERGLIHMVEAKALGGSDGAEVLAQAIERALQAPAPVLGPLALDGARHAAACVAEFAAMQHGPDLRIQGINP